MLGNLVSRLTANRQKQQGAGSESGAGGQCLSCPKPERRFRIKRVIVAQLITLVIFGIALAPNINTPFYNLLLFFPSPHDANTLMAKSRFLDYFEKHDHVKERDCAIALSDGNMLDGWYFKLPKSDKVVLISHGNAGNNAYRLSIIKLLLDCGVSVFAYDYEGFGYSTGKPSIANISRDGLAACDYVRDHLHYKGQQIILLGESLGTGVTGYVASHRKVGGVVLVSGLTSLSEAGKAHIGWLNLYPDECFPTPRFDNLALARGAHPPLLLIHGDTDFTLSCDYSKKMFNQGSEPKQLVILPQTGHNNVFRPENTQVLMRSISGLLAKIGAP